MLADIRFVLANHSNKLDSDPAHKKTFNGEVRASQPRSDYADYPSNYSKGSNKPPPYFQAPQTRDQPTKEEQKGQFD